MPSIRRLRAVGSHLRLTGAAAGTPEHPTPPSPAGVVGAPTVTADPDHALACLERDGFVLLQCVDPAEAERLSDEQVEAEIALVAPRVFGPRLVHANSPICKRLGPDSGRERPGDKGLERNQPHMDTA